MNDSAEPPPPQPVAIHPRPLTEHEQALLDFVAAPIRSRELAEQVKHAEVISLCSCGCPSIGLRSAGPAVPREVVAALNESDRDWWLAVVAP